MIDFDAMVAEVVNATGWTWDYVEDALTAPRLKALIEEWRQRPSLPGMVAAAAGYKAPARRSSQPQQSMLDSVRELGAMFPGGVIGG